MPDPSQFNTDRTYPGRWTITFSNPPINMFVPTTIVELGALMTDLEADPSVKVVVFQSANPDFFIAHLDVSKAAERPEVLGLWRDFVLRLSSTPVVSIAKIRGRTRGIGNEFVLACDMRFASRQSALFGNPEIGVGLVPGDGALEWLPRLVGRSRALEIVLSGDDFDADIAERYGWVNRTLDDADLDSFVDTLVRRLASFDREALAAEVANRDSLAGEPAGQVRRIRSALGWRRRTKAHRRSRFALPTLVLIFFPKGRWILPPGVYGARSRGVDRRAKNKGLRGGVWASSTIFFRLLCRWRRKVGGAGVQIAGFPWGQKSWGEKFNAVPMYRLGRIGGWRRIKGCRWWGKNYWISGAIGCRWGVGCGGS